MTSDERIRFESLVRQQVQAGVEKAREQGVVCGDAVDFEFEYPERRPAKYRDAAARERVRIRSLEADYAIDE